jgi:hypothetical protein
LTGRVAAKIFDRAFVRVLPGAFRPGLSGFVWFYFRATAELKFDKTRQNGTKMEP